MQRRISFGTDGWRSKLDEGFTSENVRRVAFAIAEHVLECGSPGKGVFIGYDGRAQSKDFAEECANVLAFKGIACYLPPGPVPTPVAAFSAVRYSLAGSIMITASHNPPEYNGIKFIPDYGGPAMPDVTSGIERHIPPESPAIPEAANRSLISELDPYEDYLRHLHGLIKGELSGLRIVLDPMHGATSGYASRIFTQMGAIVETVRDRIDPIFGGAIPDPTPENLSGLKSRVIASGSDLGVAFDGDGDRLTAVTRDGIFLAVNQLLPLVYLHLMERRSMIGDAARTVATSHLVDRVADDHGQKVVEVPVGFKYIGVLLRERAVVIGGEESGGMSFSNHIPEKDGIASAAFLMEAAKSSGKGLGGLYQDMVSRYGRLSSARLDLRTSFEGDVIRLIEGEVAAKGEIMGSKVSGVNRKDGIKIILGNGSWMLFRKSGTENVVRVYAESSDDAFTAALLSYGKSLVFSFI
ncbi:MAG: phosphoglucomutase/phosphomannomutase family protein [Candidatus Verstraetearchaeota archaeon]|nr:phosphoglucomutase/phosphomannomutase family protein [Candidatus Verstraetearchaeota archaeon]